MKYSIDVTLIHLQSEVVRFAISLIETHEVITRDHTIGSACGERCECSHETATFLTDYRKFRLLIYSEYESEKSKQKPRREDPYRTLSVRPAKTKTGNNSPPVSRSGDCPSIGLRRAHRGQYLYRNSIHHTRIAPSYSRGQRFRAGMWLVILYRAGVVTCEFGGVSIV